MLIGDENITRDQMPAMQAWMLNPDHLRQSIQDVLNAKIGQGVMMPQTQDNETRYRLLQLRKEVQKSPEKWTVDLMADNFYLTRSHFSVLYKKTFGVTPQSDIRFFVNEKALNLLNTTDLTIQQISQMCGYNECENFIRAFKKMNGTSPHHYRKIRN